MLLVITVALATAVNSIFQGAALFFGMVSIPFMIVAALTIIAVMVKDKNQKLLFRLFAMGSFILALAIIVFGIIGFFMSNGGHNG